MEGSKQLQPIERTWPASLDQLDDRVERGIAADQARESATFAELTGGRFEPQVAYGRRFAGHLAVGEIAIEPALGPARIAAVEHDGDALAVTWKDDYGPSTASARYGVDQVFFVRVPGPRDRLAIQQQVDRATWRRSDIPGSTARLIAAHLHLGPRSVLFRFAVNGGILDERLYDELDQIKRNRANLEPWVNALAGYCLSREDTGPVPGWVPDRPEPAIDAAPSESPVRTKLREQRMKLGRYVAGGTVEQLMDAAFELGVAAAKANARNTSLGRLARVRAAALVRRKRSLRAANEASASSIHAA